MAMFASRHFASGGGRRRARSLRLPGLRHERFGDRQHESRQRMLNPDGEHKRGTHTMRRVKELTDLAVLGIMRRRRLSRLLAGIRRGRGFRVSNVVMAMRVSVTGGFGNGFMRVTATGMLAEHVQSWTARRKQAPEGHQAPEGQKAPEAELSNHSEHQDQCFPLSTARVRPDRAGRILFRGPPKSTSVCDLFRFPEIESRGTHRRNCAGAEAVPSPQPSPRWATR